MFREIADQGAPEGKKSQYAYKVVFVNKTPPGSEWAGIIDYHVGGETDAWAGRVLDDWNSVSFSIIAERLCRFEALRDGRTLVGFSAGKTRVAFLGFIRVALALAIGADTDYTLWLDLDRAGPRVEGRSTSHSVRSKSEE